MGKVTLINFRINDMPFMPLGVLYLAAVLEKNGFMVQVLDPFAFESDKVMLDSISSFDPDYIGFSIVTPSYQKVKAFKRKLMTFFTDRVYFAGGVHPTALPEKTLTDIGLDFVVIGEGEYALLDTLKALEDGSTLDIVEGITFRDKFGGVKHNPLRKLIGDLDKIPFPARHLLNVERYFIPPGYIRGCFFERVANLLTSRGCALQCIFCSSHLLSGRQMRKRSIVNTLQEIDILIKYYKVEAIYLSDEAFTADTDWLIDFGREIKKRDLPWGCTTRIDLLNEPLIEQMKDAGCIQIDLGLESGSNRILKILKKNITSEKIKKTFPLLKKNAIKTFATLMVGNPEERKSDIIETKMLLMDIEPDYTLVSWFTPFPGTEAYNSMLEKGLRPDNIETDYDFVTSDRPSVNLTDMKMEELIIARAYLQRAVFLRNYLSIVKLRNLKYLSEAFLIGFLSPFEFLMSLNVSIRAHSLDYLIYFIFYNYQRFKIQQKMFKGSVGSNKG